MNPPENSRRATITDEDAKSITRVEELAYELKVQEVMSPDVKALNPNMALTDVLDIFREKHISGAPVVVGDQIVGVLSIEDGIRALRQGQIDSSVRDFMSHTVIAINAHDPVVEALKTFVSKNIGRLPVIDDNGRLVGIITKGDITRGLLKALQQDYQVEEVIRYRASHLFEDIVSDRTSLILRYDIRHLDFNHGGSASSYIKRALLRLGATPQIARRCGIAIYEAEMNLIIHATHGGILRIEIEPNQVLMEAYDDGPGIADVNLAMKPGYSTASEEIRELGFGAGMGLVNIARCVDEMTLESKLGSGTRLRMKIMFKEQDTIGEARATTINKGENP